MTGRPGRNHTPAFRAKVALAVKGDRTLRANLSIIPAKQRVAADRMADRG
jgi:hypothetical protein